MMSELTGSLPHSKTDPSPRIESYLPASDKRSGVGLIIFPGGGYGGLAEHEGKDYAEFFRNEGICCFVVSYRLGSQGFRHPAMLEDALSAVHEIRNQADSLGLKPNKIGVMGSSAGGHLAAHSLVSYGTIESPVSLRPDFGILCYPVIAMSGEHCHTGSRANLLGDHPSEELIREVSCDDLVTAQTPPCFIWHTYEDAGVLFENSLLFAAALRRNGVPFELHIYHKGRHGLGLNADFSWANDCLRWINDITR